MIKNKTKNTVICENTKILSSVFSKAKGLMFSRKIKDTGFIFIFNKPTRVDLHMFFVFFPIDVLFLDKHKKVVEIKENLKPFAIYFSKNKAKYVVELPEGIIAETKTEVGEIIHF
ncbi:DUF192 domain-containing protein [Candidatus Woesearchaeota archaeon]|nr:DUF192 domain-containing protein [Candidatus Woesearchaeota archaeon]